MIRAIRMLMSSGNSERYHAVALLHNQCPFGILKL
jgi:hypothetical protein